jgi:hypothetical protein
MRYICLPTNKHELGLGASGHEWGSGVAIEKLADTIPASVRTPEAAAQIAVMGRELDRSKGSGERHDKERDSSHYMNLAEDGSVIGVLRSTREVAMRAP